jgi:hypothetical protein
LLLSVQTVPFEILQLLPIVFFVDQFNAAMQYEVSVIWSHSSGIDYCASGNFDRNDLFVYFANERLDLRKFLNIFELELLLKLSLVLL